MEVSHSPSQATLLSVRWAKKAVMGEGLEVIHWPKTDLDTAIAEYPTR